MILSIFSCACWPSLCRLWRNICLGLQSTFDWVDFLILNYMRCLYILEINPLSGVPFANIFSHSEGCLFVVFMVSVCCAKVFKFK